MIWWQQSPFVKFRGLKGLKGLSVTLWRRRFRWFGVVACTIVLWSLLTSTVPSWAQDADSAQDTPSDTTEEVTESAEVSRLPVSLNGEPLFFITSEYGVQSIPDRTATVTRNIEALAQSQEVSVDSLTPAREGEVIYIRAGDLPVMVVTEADATATNTTLDRLSNQYLEAIRNGVITYRQENSFGYVAWAIARLIIATLLLLGLRLLLKAAMRRVNRRFPPEKGPFLPSLTVMGLQLLPAAQASALAMQSLQWLRRILFAAAVIAYGIYALGLFPFTRGLRQMVASQLSGTLQQAGEAAIAYLPNFFGICLIVALCHYALKTVHPLFMQLHDGAIKLPGFYREWAKPTYRLVAFFLIALATVLGFPLLPGFGSDAFQGVSLVIGVVVSLGSTGAMSNAVAGIILIYTRSFQVGDRVAFGDLLGDVEEKLLLVTRLRTFDNVIITIPNAALLSGNIINYSASIRETQQPVSFATQITLGYDVPWREVNQVLGKAAIATNYVISNPAPVIFQVGLGDFSVAYEVKVFTNHPNEMERILSDLHQNIQDQCNVAGIEILSPTYSAVRDGNTSTLPESYLPENYTAPGFQLNPLGNLFQVDLHTRQPTPRQSRSPRQGRPNSRRVAPSPPPANTQSNPSPSFSVQRPNQPSSRNSPPQNKGS
ncbi:MAG: mechanosensitive ion channel domain-containing protein [Cyanobacteria bacterium P01_C01_bin.89]